MRKSILTALVIGLALLPAASAAAFSPGRPTVNWPSNSKNIVFDSALNNPAVGDEREFLLVRNYGDNSYTDNLKVHDGQEVVLRVYYHNNATKNQVASNTRVGFGLPNAAASTVMVSASIDADNANPRAVSDTAQLVSDQPFTLEYEKGSAQIWNNNLRGKTLNDSVVSTGGTLIGMKKIDGKIAGGGDNSGYVTIIAKVHYQSTSQAVTSTGANSGKIANSGPGDVAAVFAGASAFGAIGHRVFSVRRKK